MLYRKHLYLKSVAEITHYGILTIGHLVRRPIVRRGTVCFPYGRALLAYEHIGCIGIVSEYDSIVTYQMAYQPEPHTFVVA